MIYYKTGLEELTDEQLLLELDDIDRIIAELMNAGEVNASNELSERAKNIFIEAAVRASARLKSLDSKGMLN